MLDIKTGILDKGQAGISNAFRECGGICGKKVHVGWS